MPEGDERDSSQGATRAPRPLSRGVQMRVFLGGFALAGAVYLLLIDTLSQPELYAGAGVTLLSAFAVLASREQDQADASISPRWLLRARGLIVRVPRDVVLVSAMALRQLVQPRPVRGALRTAPFVHGGENPRDAGRRALAEALGSIAPNTIVVGVDDERDLLLVHQLWQHGDTSELDALELG